MYKKQKQTFYWTELERQSEHRAAFQLKQQAFPASFMWRGTFLEGIPNEQGKDRDTDRF
jgi:hypothetical protein